MSKYVISFTFENSIYELNYYFVEVGMCLNWDNFKKTFDYVEDKGDIFFTSAGNFRHTYFLVDEDNIQNAIKALKDNNRLLPFLKCCFNGLSIVSPPINILINKDDLEATIKDIISKNPYPNLVYN